MYTFLVMKNSYIKYPTRIFPLQELNIKRFQVLFNQATWCMNNNFNFSSPFFQAFSWRKGTFFVEPIREIAVTEVVSQERILLKYFIEWSKKRSMEETSRLQEWKGKCEWMFIHGQNEIAPVWKLSTRIWKMSFS